MEGVTIEPPKNTGSAGASVFAFAMKRVCVGIPPGISPQEVRQSLPAGLLRDAWSPAEILA